MDTCCSICKLKLTQPLPELGSSLKPVGWAWMNIDVINRRDVADLSAPAFERSFRRAAAPITPHDQRIHHRDTFALRVDDDRVEIYRIDVVAMICGKTR